MLTIRDGLKYEQARLIKDIAMLQKLKVTSYAFIYFLMFGFSFYVTASLVLPDNQAFEFLLAAQPTLGKETGLVD